MQTGISVQDVRAAVFDFVYSKEGEWVTFDELAEVVGISAGTTQEVCAWWRSNEVFQLEGNAAKIEDSLVEDLMLADAAMCEEEE